MTTNAEPLPVAEQTEIEQVGARLRALGEREVTGAHGVG